MARKFWVFDMDGTLADSSHRSPLAESGDWNGFFEPKLMMQDKPIEPTLDMARGLWRLGCGILILTGRPSQTGGATRLWLAKHAQFSIDGLVMRSPSDWRPATEMKAQALEENMAQWRRRIVGAVDDDPAMAEVFRRLCGCQRYTPSPPPCTGK